jgi:hypothetical protein
MLLERLTKGVHGGITEHEEWRCRMFDSRAGGSMSLMKCFWWGERISVWGSSGLYAHSDKGHREGTPEKPRGGNCQVRGEEREKGKARRR